MREGKERPTTRDISLVRSLLTKENHTAVPPGLGKEVAEQRAAVPECPGGAPATEKQLDTARACSRGWPGAGVGGVGAVPAEAGLRDAAAPGAQLRGVSSARCCPLSSHPTPGQPTVGWSHRARLDLRLHRSGKPSWTRWPHPPLLAAPGLG